jgi:NitT/TauT family transport system substrate-binding protein
MKKMRKTTVLIFIAVLLAIPMTSCSGNKKGDGNVDKLTVIYSTTILSHPVVAVAREKNYFKEEGLDIEYITLASGAIEALSIGKADMLLTGIIPTLSYAAQGADVKIIGGTISGGNFFVAKKENAESLRNIKNWVGKKLGTVRLSTSEMVTRYALEEQGIDVKKDITYVEIDTYPNIIEGVRKGLADIGAVDPQYIQAALDLGLEIIFLMTDLSPNYICCREAVYSKSLEANPRAFEKFLKAQIRAYKYFLEQPDDVIKILAKASSQDENWVRRVLYDKKANGNRTFHPDPDINRSRKVYDTLDKWNYIQKKGIKIEDIFDTTLYKKALDEIIKENPKEEFYLELLEVYKKNNT